MPLRTPLYPKSLSALLPSSRRQLKRKDTEFEYRPSSGRFVQSRSRRLTQAIVLNWSPKSSCRYDPGGAP